MIKKILSQVFSIKTALIAILTICVIWFIFIVIVVATGLQQPIVKYSYVETVIDNCQYIKIIGSDAWVHKGNCNNPIHQNQTDKYK